MNNNIESVATLQNDYFKADTINVAKALYGIDLEAGTFDPTALMDAVESLGGCLQLYGEELTIFETFMNQLISTPANGYDDGYSKNILTNLAVKLNGIYLENYIAKYANGHLSRNSSAVFSITKNYENASDFTVNSYNIGNTVIKPASLEIKNCQNMQSFINCRTHNSLYVLVNSREENKLRLLCRLRKQDRTHLQDFETYGDYKVIESWFWLDEIIRNYNKAYLENSWTLQYCTYNNVRYLTITSPSRSGTKYVR